MKVRSIFVILIILMCLLSVSCNKHTKAEMKVGIPDKVEYIEFWNGGTMIRRYENAQVKLVVEKGMYLNPNLTQPDVSVTFYTYIIETPNGGIERIIDSESLCILYKPKQW